MFIFSKVEVAARRKGVVVNPHQVKASGQIKAIQQVLSIGPNLEPKDIVYFLKTVEHAVVWQAFLELQFQLCRPAEMFFLAQSEAFSKAGNVLEIGRGDNSVYGGIAALFPEKKFVGAVMPTRQSLGEKHKTKESLELIDSQIPKEFYGKFNYLILRVVVQKVSQLGLFIDTVKEYLAPGGTLLIYDAEDSVSRWKPPIPTLDALMSALREEQAKTGVGRSAAEKVRRRASLYGLTPVRNEKMPVQSYGETGKRDFYTYLLLLSEAMNRAYEDTIDQVSLIAELNHWIADDDSHIQLGINLVELMRRP